MKKNLEIIIFLFILIPICGHSFYPDSVYILGNTRFCFATGETSINRVSVHDSGDWIHAVFAYKWGVTYADSSEIFYVYSSNGGIDWSQMENVSRTGPLVSYRPTLAIDSQDNLRCIWKQHDADSNSFDLCYSYYDGITWSDVENITKQYFRSNTGHYISVVIDLNDYVHVVYDTPMDSWNVYYVCYNGISWSTPLNLSNVVTGTARHPCITVDFHNHVHVVWHEGILMKYTYYDGVTWSAPEVIASSEDASVNDNCIVVDSQCHPHVVWSWSFLDSSNIYYTRFDGNNWINPINVSNTDTTARAPSLAIDSLDNLYLAWQGPTNIYLQYHDGMAWSETLNVTQDTIKSRRPKLNNPFKGEKLDLIWINNTYPYYTIFYLGLGRLGLGIEENNECIKGNRDIIATIFSGPFQLPKDKECKVFDITGREAKPHLLQPGIYFIEIEGKITQKVIKVR